MFKLRLQFFWVMLALTSLMSVGIYLFIKVSFKEDFWDYIEKKETRFAQPLVDDLTKNYAAQNNWDWITDWNGYLNEQLQAQRNNWRREMRSLNFGDKNMLPPPHEHHHNDHEAHEQGDDDHKEKNPFKSWRDSRQRPPMEALRTLYLEDAQHKVIRGIQAPQDDSFLIPLKMNGKVVGYLGIPFNPAIRDLQDANFAKVQENKVGFIVIAALVLSVLAAFPLAHLLTTRIQRLVEQVTRYTKGNYQEKLILPGQDEINVLAEHLNKLGETLAHTETTRRQWVADISHELRTPIAVLQAELEAMEDGVRTLDATAVKRLIKHSERLKFLVNDLYELSLTDLGGMTYQKKNIDLQTPLQEAISSMLTQFTQAGVDIDLHIPNGVSPFYGDPQRLQQLFINLLKNSLHYTNSPGRTKVTLLNQENTYRTIIEDTPPGVTEEHLSKLFDRLYRVDSSRARSSGGAGLGLSICKNIVLAHDGKISASASELGGLKITIELPHRG